MGGPALGVEFPLDRIPNLNRRNSCKPQEKIEIMPAPLTRRQVLQTASLLGVSAVLSQEANADDAPLIPQSGLVTGQMKPLKYDEIPGLLTRAQVAPHYQAHYGGALRRFVVLDERINTALLDNEMLDGDACTLMRKDIVNRMNSVLLHELYFDGLTAKPGNPAEGIRTAIGKRFGSLDRWAEDFRTCCMAANGWGILARDIVNGQLYNVASDLHEIGVLWLGQPLVVCDVYEHAFYVDYQNRKQEYVNKFVKFLDWNETDRRWKALARA
jgi:Fe-Mn family superoxide dismutase